MYFVRGRTATAAAGAADIVFWQLWNGHADCRIRLMAFSWQTEAGQTTAADGFRMRRSTVRGTAGSTVTPDLDNQGERGVAQPTNSILLDLASFSVQPTTDTSELGPGFVSGDSSAGSSGGLWRYPGGLVIPPGTGLCAVRTKVDLWPVSTISIFVKVDW